MAQILVLDDDSNIVKLVEALLSGQGHAVAGHTGAPEALSALQTAPFDLILLDLIMPDFTGVDFLNALRALKIQVPVVILSGQNQYDTVVEASKLGAVGYLVKPFRPDALIERVTAALGGRRG